MIFLQHTLHPLYTCQVVLTRTGTNRLDFDDDSGSGSNITVDLFDGDPASANKFNLFKTKALTANETLQLLTEPLIMQESEVLQVTAADANRLFVVASILEINREDR